MFARRSVLQVRRLVARCEGEVRRGGKCINSVQLLGYAGGEPKRSGPEARPVTKFTLATSVYYTIRDQEFPDAGKLQKKTTWHNISVFRPYLQDKVNSFVTKGTRLLVQGSIDNYTYDDQDGIRRFASNVIPVSRQHFDIYKKTNSLKDFSKDDIIILSRPAGTEEESDFVE